MKKWMVISLWSIAVLGIIVLVGYIDHTQSTMVLNHPEPHVHVEGENQFLTEAELLRRLEQNNLIYEGQTMSQLDINEIESNILKMNEIKSAKVYTHIGPNWEIEVELRSPIARIFNQQGESFYLDNEGFTMLPSNLHTARVLIVNGAIPDKLNGPNVSDIESKSELEKRYVLDDIYYLANHINQDQFLAALIAQVHLSENGDFIMIPQVGGHTINFGTAKSPEEVKRKFDKLKIFYKEGLPYEGWRKYSEVSVKFKGQIVCKKKFRW